MGQNQVALTDTERTAFVNTYKIPKDQYKKIIKSFKTHAVKGKITREIFLGIYVKHGIMDSALSNLVFDSFDKDKNGMLELREYMAMMGVIYGGTIDQKLEASFSVLDKNGDKLLSKEEIRDMLIIIIKQLERTKMRTKYGDQVTGSTPVLIDSQVKLIENILKEVFDKVDTDGSGTIDKDEFFIGFSKHPDVCEFFKQF
eukprot:TRINITY_DN1486_c0_g1_i1.p1 TRINITY_DN1486_c0_g1~~TRINITY_DN1486_c0_g1_i1.p1  ORF type:complete len:200 (+),score=32.06 TRINITY_DN1486_c0_g1_i1:50-649(+)